MIGESDTAVGGPQPAKREVATGARRPSPPYFLRFVAIGCLLLWWLPAALSADDTSAIKEDVRIGLARSLFRDLSNLKIQLATSTFGDLMKKQTGLAGKIVDPSDPLELAQQLQDGKVELGVFHGVEFAWAQERYPDLQPLMIAINKNRHLHAVLVVKHNCEATCFGDLRGKSFTIPCRSREHCHLFLQRHCRDQGAEPKDFFDKIVNHPGAEGALDDIVRGKIHAAVVDGVFLEWYERVNPGRFSGLKIVQRSEAFPAGVIVYRKGALDDAKLQRLRKGLLEANRDETSRAYLTMWNLTAIEEVPEDYQKTLGDIRRIYPAPEAAKPALKAAVPTGNQ